MIEENYESRMKYEHVVRPLSLILLPRGISVKGKQNKIEKGANIIVANHPTDVADVAALVRLYRKQLYFIANSDHFYPSKLNWHIRKQIKRNYHILSPFLLPITSLVIYKSFLNSCSRYIKEIGSIPIDVHGNGIYNGDFVRISKQRLLDNLPLVFLQFNLRNALRNVPSEYDPTNKEIKPFLIGAPKLALKVFEEYNIDVPITPISIKGTSKFSVAPIKVNIGESIYPSAYVNKEKPAEFLRQDLEKKVVELYHKF